MLVSDEIRTQVRELFLRCITGHDLLNSGWRPRSERLDDYADRAIDLVEREAWNLAQEELGADGWHGPEECAELCLQQHGPFEPLYRALMDWHTEHHVGPSWLCHIPPCKDVKDYLR